MLERHGHRRSPRPEHRHLAISKSAHCTVLSASPPPRAGPRLALSPARPKRLFGSVGGAPRLRDRAEAEGYRSRAQSTHDTQRGGDCLFRRPVLASNILIRELPIQDRTEVLSLVKLLAQLARTLVAFPQPPPQPGPARRAPRARRRARRRADSRNRRAPHRPCISRQNRRCAR